MEALGQQRRQALRGGFLLLSGEVCFGFRIEDEALVSRLLDSRTNRFLSPDDPLRDVVRGGLANVLSANVDDPRVVDALGSSLRGASQILSVPLLQALSLADPEQVRPC